MKRFRKYGMYLMLGLAVAGAAVGCKKRPKETEPSSETMTESTKLNEEVEVTPGTPTTQTKLYTAKDRSFSIVLPDSSWKETKNSDDTLVFESAGQGSITITHLSGETAASVKLPETKEEVLENFTTAGKDAEKYEVQEFKKTAAGSTDQYHTVIKCSDSAEDYRYSVGYDIAAEEEIYSVTGLIKEDDEDLLEEVKTAVESFKVLGKTTSGNKGGTSTGETGDSQGSGSESTGTVKVIYDSKGNPITVTKNSDGTWSDSTGKTYDMQQYGVMGSDGYWYTYSAPSTGNSGTGSNNGSNDNNNDNNNNSNNNNGGENNGANGNTGNTGNNGGSTSADTSGFYDQDGNYVSVTKDANGNWVDAYGTVYYFGDSGVTDNTGNYYPYKDSSESTGFYDSQGNYITVTKNANGEWVDSSGAKYVFGETGVTDEAGNFYPY